MLELYSKINCATGSSSKITSPCNSTSGFLVIFVFLIFLDSWEACKGILTEQSDFDQWFVVMGEEWQNSPYLETEDIRIPYDFLDTNADECLKVFEGYVEKFMEAEQRAIRE